MDNNEIGKTDLGHGIYLLENDAEKSIEGTVIFLDKILLPCGLPDLSIDQIKVINRYRESIKDRDDNGGRASGSRKMFRFLVNSLKPKRMLEIGGGKFPIFREEFQNSYCGVEIDDEAIVAARNIGLATYDLPSFVQLSKSEYKGAFDLIIGSFSFHFGFEDAFLEAIHKSLNVPKGLLAFNFISQDSLDLFEKISFFCSRGLHVRIMKGPNFATREYLALLSTDSVILRHEVFAQIECGDST